MTTSIAHTLLHHRCPACGQGKIFEKLASVVAVCAPCHLPLGKADLGDGPAFIILSLLCVVVTPLLVVLAFIYAWPTGVLIGVAAISLGGSTLLLLRPVRAALIALQYQHRPDTFYRHTLGQS